MFEKYDITDCLIGFLLNMLRGDPEYDWKATL
jgi:hypothetical protein